jgi:hypothetical protein
VAALDDLGVAGDDLHVAARAAARDRLDLGAQDARLEPLLEDERQRQRQRRRAGHREVVDRAVDASSPIEPAGEADGLTTKLSVVIASAGPSTVTARVAELVERVRCEAPARARPR